MPAITTHGVLWGFSLWCSIKFSGLLPSVIVRRIIIPKKTHLSCWLKLEFLTSSVVQIWSSDQFMGTAFSGSHRPSMGCSPIRKKRWPNWHAFCSLNFTCTVIPSSAAHSTNVNFWARWFMKKFVQLLNSDQLVQVKPTFWLDWRFFSLWRRLHENLCSS